MRTNAEAVALIKKYEGLRLEAYLCPAGKWTIGYGHTEGVKEGHCITQHQAEVMLDYDIEEREEQLDRCVSMVALNDNEYSALLSLLFNIGVKRFAASQLLKKLLAGDRKGAAEEFMKWRLAAGVVQPGLVKRRAEERALFLTPVPSTRVA